MIHFGRILQKRYKELVTILLLIVLSACHRPAVHNQHEMPVFTTYRDIPGVTEDEIKAVGALRDKTPFFVYGMLSCTEAFIGETGEIRGFTDLFCKWLSQLFEIPFKPAI